MSKVLSGEDYGEWDLEIKPSTGLLDVNLRDLWKYRDLLFMFVKRDIVTVYKQTILGPVWFFVQPIMTTLMYILVFGNIANISTDGLPKALFYLSGITVWNYFSESLTSTSKTFTENSNIFGKVYFPRLIMPISKVISGLIKFFIQISLFMVVWIYYIIKGMDVTPTWHIIFVPYLILLMAGLGLGLGIIFSSLTTKYRDLTFLIVFGIQLLMYATPVIYPLSALDSKYKSIILMNPLTPILEGFRYAFLGAGSFNYLYLAYSSVFTLITLIIGVVIFNRVQKSFMDTV